MLFETDILNNSFAKLKNAWSDWLVLLNQWETDIEWQFSGNYPSLLELADGFLNGHFRYGNFTPGITNNLFDNSLFAGGMPMGIQFRQTNQNSNEFDSYAVSLEACFILSFHLKSIFVASEYISQGDHSTTWARNSDFTSGLHVLMVDCLIEDTAKTPFMINVQAANTSQTYMTDEPLHCGHKMSPDGDWPYNQSYESFPSGGFRHGSFGSFAGANYYTDINELVAQFPKAGIEPAILSSSGGVPLTTAKIKRSIARSNSYIYTNYDTQSKVIKTQASILPNLIKPCSWNASVYLVLFSGGVSHQTALNNFSPPPFNPSSTIHSPVFF